MRGLRKFLLVLTAVVFAPSATISAVSTNQFRSLNDQIWYEKGCSTSAQTIGTPASGATSGETPTEGHFDTTSGTNGHRMILVHTTENDSIDATKQALRQNGTSYHMVIDQSGKEFRLLTDDQIANGAKSANNDSLHVSLVGTAGDGRHFDPKSPQLQTLSKRIAEWAGKYEIPMEKVSGPGILNGGNTKGVAGHADVANADPAAYAGNGRTDPGAGFPWAEVLANAKASGGGTSALASTNTSSSSTGSNVCCAPGGGGITGTASTGDGGGCGSDTDMEANKQQIWSFLKNKGLSDAAAAGILGNAEKESSFNPKAKNSLGCGGFVQWCFSRTVELESFARERGKTWDCLGVQLEYMWHEMEDGKHIGRSDGKTLPNGMKLYDALNGADFPERSQYTGTESGIAAKIFHDYFERSNTATGEDKGRPEAADAQFLAMTGKEPSTLTGGGTAGGANCPSGGAGVMSADCGALVTKFKELRLTKLNDENTAASDKDLANCTTGEILSGSDQIHSDCVGRGIGGVSPNLLRAVIAATENSGDEKLSLGNMNSGHFCDKFNHPVGKGADISCYIPSVSNRSAGPSAEKCLRIFKYLYDNYDQLGLVELIWNEDTSFSKMGDGKHTSYVSEHENHIHIGVKE